MPRKCTVLMYHATPTDPSDLLGADPHYAVYLDVFERHLDCIASRQRVATAIERISKTKDSSPIGMTFDDGHGTNWFAALALAKRGWSGTFFVNPSTVGSPNFLSWDQLAAMSEMGMSIQSHGLNHRYQDECSMEEQWEDIHESKVKIEQQLKVQVTTFAPPGGRMSTSTRALANKAGYTLINTSRVGIWAVDSDSPFDVPRLAVLHNTSVEQIRSWIDHAPLELANQIWRYRILNMAKRLLGNRRYEAFRLAILRTQKGN